MEVNREGTEVAVRTICRQLVDFYVDLISKKVKLLRSRAIFSLYFKQHQNYVSKNRQ